LTLITLLGLGTLFLSLSSQYSQAVYALLFGEVLGIGNAAVTPVAVISLAVIAATLLLFRPLLLTAVAPDLGAARGISNRLIDVAFLSILGLATAMALPVVGALLVFSLMVGPAAAARALTRRPIFAMLVSAGIALLMVWSAIALSYWSNWPVGFFIGTLAAMCYGVGRAWTRFGG
jgi:zinc/manganese transport system permease protein